MIILGIDPGSLVTGYGVIHCQGNRFSVIDAGPLRLKKLGEMHKRLAFLGDELERLIKEHKPNVLSLEKVFHGVNFKSAMALGQVRGVALMAAGRHDLDVAEYSPTEVKKAVTGYGRAEKEQMQEMVRLLLNLRETPKPNDVADALALAICHANTSPVLQRFSRK